MAEIVTYKCSNTSCGLTVRLSRGLPLWHEQTPLHLRTPEVAPHAFAYIAGVRSESFCYSCRKVVAHTAGDECSNCQSNNIHEEQLGRVCPRCSEGTFVMPHISIY